VRIGKQIQRWLFRILTENETQTGYLCTPGFNQQRISATTAPRGRCSYGAVESLTTEVTLRQHILHPERSLAPAS